jgi:hypothetical protein
MESRFVEASVGTSEDSSQHILEFTTVVYKEFKVRVLYPSIVPGETFL